jgi:cysteine desulfurase/selenocysteine lyase
MRVLGVPATTRASFAVHNTRDDVDRLIDGLGRVREVLRLADGAPGSGVAV